MKQLRHLKAWSPEARERIEADTARREQERAEFSRGVTRVYRRLMALQAEGMSRHEAIESILADMKP